MKKIQFVLLLSLFCSLHASADLLVPAYFYPSSNPNLSYWDELTAAAQTNNITAIVNPNSGPGTAANSDYTSAISSFRAAGGKVVAYVYTNYGARAQSQVLADVASYSNFYQIDGVFLDEMSNNVNDLAYYQSLYGDIKSANSAYRVFANPGTNTAESFLTAADVLVTYENDPVSGNYAGYTPDAWTANYSADHFAHLLYNVASSTDALALAAVAQDRNVGYTYITDDILPNPWDRLPSYWSQETTASVPLSSSNLFMISALFLFGFTQRNRAAAFFKVTRS